MKENAIAILGGTGDQGLGLALRFARAGRPVVIGSRKPERAVEAAETIQRCIYLMVSEAVRCLEEGVVRSPGELDLAMVMGIGFPPFRGGLCRYADSVGLQSVVDGLRGWQDKLGQRFEPPSALVERAKSGKGFYG